MPLSAVKLQKLLNVNGFFINSIFTIDGQAVYLDIFYSSNADNFLLYIPSRYEIAINHDLDEKTKTYNLKDLDEKELLAKHSEFELGKQYDKIESYLEADTQSTKNIEKLVTEDYDKDISIENMTVKEVGSVKDLTDQIHRLKLCVKNIKYKVAVVSKCYMACVRRDNDVDLFYVEKMPPVYSRKIYVIVDMESLFSDPSNTPREIKGVKTAIYKILSENQSKHARLLNTLLTKRTDVNTKSVAITQQKQVLDFYLNHLEELLTRTLEAEKEKVETIVQERSTRGTVTGVSSFYSDMDKGTKLARLEKELQEINEIKHEVVTEILKLRGRQENLTLEIDRILCENILSINKINQNFNSMSKLK